MSTRDTACYGTGDTVVTLIMYTITQRILINHVIAMETVIVAAVAMETIVVRLVVMEILVVRDIIIYPTLCVTEVIIMSIVVVIRICLDIVAMVTLVLATAAMETRIMRSVAMKTCTFLLVLFIKAGITVTLKTLIMVLDGLIVTIAIGQKRFPFLASLFVRFFRHVSVVDIVIMVGAVYCCFSDGIGPAVSTQYIHQMRPGAFPVATVMMLLLLRAFRAMRLLLLSSSVACSGISLWLQL